jgi:hypothetical protein
VALHQAVISAYEIYGFPATDSRQSCLNDDKWEHYVCHVMQYLGFLLDTRKHSVTWPYDKREDLRQDIEEAITNHSRISPCLHYTVLQYSTTVLQYSNTVVY